MNPSNTGAPGRPDKRLLLPDGLRAIAAVAIVLHHFALYGPLARGLASDWPRVSAWLTEYGRYAVYVFLVVAGFTAAQTFVHWSTRPVVPAARLILRRYLRLVMPFAAALMLAIFCAALARHWGSEAYVPGPVSLSQFLAHLALLEGVLGFESLSTGVWYVAVEMQLYVGMLLLLKLPTWLPRRDLPVGLIAALVLASWLFWHGRPALDNWAPYFFGAYGLGVLSWWAAHARFARQRLFWRGVVAVTAILLLIDWRGRLLVALATALALSRWGLRPHHGSAWARFIHWLGVRSYALFLVHFPVLLVLNTLIGEGGAIAGAPAATVLLAGLAASLLAATLFHAGVEAPCLRLLQPGDPARRWALLRWAMLRVREPWPTR